MDYVNPDLDLNDLRTLFNFHRPDGRKLTELMDEGGVPHGVQQAIHAHLFEEYDQQCLQAWEAVRVICPRPHILGQQFKKYLLRNAVDGTNAAIAEELRELSSAGKSAAEYEQERAEIMNSESGSFIGHLRELMGPDINTQREMLEGTGRKRPMLIRATSTQIDGAYFLFHVTDKEIKALRFSCKQKTIRTKAKAEMQQDGFILSVEEENPSYYHQDACRTWADAKRSLKESSTDVIEQKRNRDPNQPSGLTAEADLHHMGFDN